MQKHDRVSPPSGAKSVRVAEIIQGAVFFAGIFFYTWFVIRPSHVFNFREYCFLIKTSFFDRPQTVNPPLVAGKPLDQLTALIMQWWSSDCAGALCVTLLSVALTLLFRALMARRASGFWLGLSYVAALLVVAAQQRYIPVLPYVISITVALLFAVIYVRLPLFNMIGRVVAGAVMGIVLFFLIGKYWVLFAACGLASGRRTWRADLIGFGLSGAVIVAGNAILSGKTVFQAAEMSFPTARYDSNDFIHIALSLALLGLCGLAWAGTLVGARLRRLGAKTEKKRPPAPLLRSPGAARLAGALCLAVVSIVIVRFSFSSNLRAFYSLHAAYSRGRYDECLKAAVKLPQERFTRYESYCVNTALFYKGRLLEDLFYYPQFMDAVSYEAVDSEPQAGILRRWLDTFKPLFDLGLINASEDCCLELLAVLSYCPEALKTLAQIQIAKGLPKAGATCLNTLAEDRRHRAWAKNRLRSLEADPNALADSAIAVSRAFWPRHDAVEPLPYRALYRYNTANRMAFEYFIASLLLESNVGELAARIGDFYSLGYATLPRAVQEGMIVYSVSTGDSMSLKGYRIDSTISATFARFNQIYQGFSAERVAAKEALARDFGTTYFFYFLYGFTWRNNRS